MRIWYFIIVLLFAGACNDGDDFFFENPVDAGNVKLIRLRADHSELLPDGKATMKFYADAYNILELPDYTPTYVGDSAVYLPGTKRDTSLIPADLLPAGLFRLLDEAGNEYPDFTFSTQDVRERSIRFHLEAGELTSGELEIRIRPLPKREYEEIEIPVIFHVLNPAKNPSVAPIKITPEVIAKNVARLNDVFNGKVTTDPNGGNARIIFRLAEYDNSGIKLNFPGVHYHEMSGNVKIEKDEDYQNYVLSWGKTLLYDYRNFLNIWLINNPRGQSALVTRPTVIDRPEDSIPGLDAGAMPSKFPVLPTDVGFFVNMSDFLNPMSSSDYFEISTVMAQYLGLLSTQVVEGYGKTNLVDGDTDYCGDTPYYRDEIASVFKHGGEANDLYFTSYHVMDRYSYKNSVSSDQVDRLRLHLERCPSRWMWKSKFAFTGEPSDWK